VRPLWRVWWSLVTCGSGYMCKQCTLGDSPDSPDSSDSLPTHQNPHISLIPPWIGVPLGARCRGTPPLGACARTPPLPVSSPLSHVWNVQTPLGDTKTALSPSFLRVFRPKRGQNASESQGEHAGIKKNLVRGQEHLQTGKNLCSRCPRTTQKACFKGVAMLGMVWHGHGWIALEEEMCLGGLHAASK
jgi:hypothetical protein